MTSHSDYLSFLDYKAISDPPTGLATIPYLPAAMFSFQRDITSWALRRGRAALFAGTGLGKSFMELAWADCVHRETGKDILHFAPLAVSAQMAREADKFGIVARQVHEQDECLSGNNITNYQKMERFDLSRFGGIILDESSILKSVDGHYRTRLIEECAGVPFRLAATATPAPNDFMELGNHAEFLGIMSYTDMLSTFFTHDGGDTQKWRLKGHAEAEFWKWVASWAVMLRKPSDLGYEDGDYVLPPLHQMQHLVAADYAPSLDTGLLFPMEARTMQERLVARRDTVDERCKLAFQVVIGSAVTKLAECLGSQNTLSADALATNPIPPSEIDGRPKGATPSRTPNTCATTMPGTKASGSARQSSRRKSTGGGASDTPLTPSSESKQKQQLEAERQSSDASSFFAESTGSTPPSMKQSSRGKTGDAQYADQSPIDFSTLITAIGQAKSEGFFAAPATPASVISRMTRSGLFEPWCIWCNLNSEQDALAKAFGPLAFSVSGSMADDEKEAEILGWIEGERPIMISKPSIMGFGMNFQHCRNTIFVGLNDSFEQVYQAIRRFWRFGQTKPVHVHFVAAETEGAVVANLRRKEADADRMADAMVKHMADLSSRAVRGVARDRPDYAPQQDIVIPSWLGAAS